MPHTLIRGLEFISKWIGDVVPTVTIKTYPNLKPWIDGSIRAKLKARSITFNHGKVTGNMAECKACSYSLRKAIKQAKNVSIERKWSGISMAQTRHMWQGLQTITDYKGKTSHVADTDILLPDTLNTFFARFENNTVPPTRPTTKDCGLSFSVTDVSKTFKHVNPLKAAGPNCIPSRVFRACADQLAGVFTDMFNLSLSQSTVPHASGWPPLFQYPRKQR